MPLYEYRCEACSGSFELLTGYAEREGQACPTCKSKQVRVIVSSFAHSGTQKLIGSGNLGGGGCCGGSCGCGSSN